MHKVILFLIAACLLASCGQKTPPQLLRLNIKGEPASLDPRKGGDITSAQLHFMLFEGLMRLTENGDVEPAQAASFDISEDGKIYTFHLRETKWSNGSSVTAHDFEKAWKDILDPSFPSVNAHLFYPIKNAEDAKRGLIPLAQVGITAHDDKTLVVELTQPTPYFLELTSFCVYFPVSSQVDKQCPDWAYHAGKQFVTNGPFVLSKWTHNDEIVLKKNPTYWNVNQVKLAGIHISMVSHELTALHMYENGDLDMIGQPLSPIPADALHAFKKQGLLKVNPVAGTTILAFNVQRFPFTNQNIRKAFAYAINREAIAKNITQLDEQPAVGAIPPVMKPNRFKAFYKDADAEQAKIYLEKGLKELGIAKEDLNGLTYTYSTSELNHKISQAIQQQWLEVLGIQVSLQNNEHKIHMDKLTKRDFAIGQSVWYSQYYDPINILERFKLKENTKNYPGWENPNYISLLDRSAYEAGNERLQTIEQAEAIFMEEMPIVPLLHLSFGFMAKPHVKTIPFSPMGGIFFERIELDLSLQNRSALAVNHVSAQVSNSEKKSEAHQ